MIEIVAQLLGSVLRLLFDLVCLYTAKLLLLIFTLGKVKVVLPMETPPPGKASIGGDMAAFIGFAFWGLVVVVAIAR